MFMNEFLQTTNRGEMREVERKFVETWSMPEWVLRKETRKWGKDGKRRKYEKMGGWTHTHTHKHKENCCYLRYVWVKFAVLNTLYKLTNSWSRDILEKLKVMEAVREFVAFYVTLKFITMFTTATSPYPEPE